MNNSPDGMGWDWMGWMDGRTNGWMDEWTRATLAKHKKMIVYNV